MDNEKTVKLEFPKHHPGPPAVTIMDKTYGERHFILEGERYVEKTLPPLVPVRCHVDRAYTMHDADSFIAAVNQYGDREKGVVFFDDSGLVMFFDQSSRKERIALPFIPSLEFKSILGDGPGKDFSQKAFLKIIETFPECFSDSAILMANVQRFEASTAIEFKSDIDPANIVYTFQEKSGIQTGKFPKKLPVRLPYFEGSKDRMTIECDFELVTPKNAEEKPRFKVIDPRHERTKRDAIQKQVETIRASLKDWLFLFGK